ncbi:MAG: SAP domain-containing protein [Anaerolineae bacterium]
MKTVERIPINNEEDLKDHALTILRRVNSDERAGLLFLLNPTYALEDAGFDLSLPMKRHIRWGLRYGTKAKARMRRLDEEIAKLAGRKVQVGSDADLGKLLFDDLQLPLPSVTPPAPSRQVQTIYEQEVEPGPAPSKADYAAQTVPELRSLLEQRGLVKGGRKQELIDRLEEHDRRREIPAITPDLLEELRDAHPILPPVIEMRELLQMGWRFVNRETYEKVKAGATVTLLRGVRFRRKRGDAESPS